MIEKEIRNVILDIEMEKLEVTSLLYDDKAVMNGRNGGNTCLIVLCHLCHLFFVSDSREHTVQ